MVKRLALLKGRHVAEQHPESWVLSADTMVSVDGHKLGKPEDTAEARKMLQLLSGRTHQVVGGFALINRGTNREIVHTVVTDVTMDVLSDYRINAYIATGEPMDKAGAYAIQGKGIQFVTSVKGSYSNVVGLPLAEVLQLLREHGIITA
jgi:septum formation protein